jgi:hypothetical protein
MSAGVSTYSTRSVAVNPAYTGIQVAPRIWIPASAGMTVDLYVQAPGNACTKPHTLSPSGQDQPSHLMDASGSRRPPHDRH